MSVQSVLVTESTKTVEVEVPVFNIQLTLEKDQFVKLKKLAGKVGIEGYVLNTLFSSGESALKNEPTPVPIPASVPVVENVRPRSVSTPTPTPTPEVVGGTLQEVRGTNLTEAEKNYLIKKGLLWAGKRMSKEQIALITARRVARAEKTSAGVSVEVAKSDDVVVETVKPEVVEEVVKPTSLVDLDSDDDASVDLDSDEEEDDESVPDLMDTILNGETLEDEDDPLGFDDEDDL